MPSNPFLASILSAALLVSTATAAVAQSAATPGTGTQAPGTSVQAVAYSPIPAGAHFETQINDDGELNREALDLVNKQLTEHGYTVEDQAPLVMVVETDLVRGQKQDDPLGQVYANNNEAKVQARLFSSNQNSLLHPEQPIGSAERTYRISLSVYDRASGLYVWRGSAMRDNPDIDIPTASAEMVPELIRTLGRSTKPAAAK